MNLLFFQKLKLTSWLSILVILCLHFITAAISPAAAQTGTGIIRVSASTGSDTAGCGSVLTPCQTIQFAVNSAGSGDTIRVAGGTYTSTAAEVVRFEGVNKTLTIIGGYSTADWNNSNPTANPTLIDGQNARRGFYINGYTGATVLNLQGLTVKNGYKSGSGNDVSGGGLYCVNGASVSLASVSFENNKAQGSLGNMNTVAGGGAAFYKCSVTLQGVTFDGNQAVGGNANANPRGAQSLGGGLFVTDRSTVNATGLIFTNNKTIAGSGGVGYSSNIYDRADANGGGIAIGANTTATFANLVVLNNLAQAGNGSAYGGYASSGGVFVELGNVTISDGLVQGNQAIAGTGSGGSAATGGGTMAIHGSLTLNRVSIKANTAQGNGPSSNGAGGGIYLSAYSSNTTLIGNNVIIADNVSSAGSSGYSTGGGLGIDAPQSVNVTLNHATFSGNNAVGGSAINVFPGGNATIRINYSIIANHSVSSAVNIGGGSTILNYTLWYNNAGDKSGPITDNNPLNGDPKFVSPGSPAFDYHIQEGSAAIDQAVGSATADDIDNQARPAGSVADLGADEHYPPLAESSKSANPTIIQAQDGPDHTVTYTIRLKNSSSQAVAATLTDVLPTSGGSVTIAFNSGPSCSSGTCNHAGGNITWSGSVPGQGEVTITYSLTVSMPTNYSESTTLSNTATLGYSDGGTPVNTVLNNALLINGQVVYLPVVLK